MSDEFVPPPLALWRRMAVTHATQRLPAASYAAAAASGLQDSAPRAGQLSLHARVEHTDPDAWRDATLMQIWFRWADYIVPRADHGIFTRGTMPRDEAHASALERLADEIERQVGEGSTGAEIRRRLEGLPLRASPMTGRIAIIWDARTVELVSVPRPEIDDEEARMALAQRFLHCYAPATPEQFAKWAGVGRGDASATWRVLEAVVPVSTPAGRSCMLRSDVEDLGSVVQPRGVRFLPQGDPALYLDAPAVPRVPATTAAVPSRVVNSLTGRIVVDGDVVGAWGRRGGTMTLFAWSELGDRLDEVEVEAASVAGAVGQQPRIRWIDERAA